ncbi:hypothetical protein [Streptomyces brevispora]|uniref:SMODS-associating 2TM beta-strand rich effector domain-containing protein n=1 Tax=Streptomyces brevispora TaxID=887462 RepID=A0ABZ1G8G9_9ACTN|nr:hypothetical protein [Streptomyces brevispora]WSC15598.1 hypothetical protein OIE64_24020 [Streptomyces brevispora]
MENSQWDQRRISTSSKTLRLPRLLLLFALVNLCWEIVKANLNSHARGDWPWRFTVLDASTCAAVVALLTGIIVTRSQLSQTMQPALSWSGFAGRSGEIADSLRTVHLINAGGGRSVVHSVSYRIQASAPHPGSAVIPTGWMTWRTAIDSLASLGLDRGHDYFLLNLGSGAAIPMSNTTREGMELLALGPRALECLTVLDIRIQVVDVLGDVYERDLQCIRPVVVAAPTRVD